MSLRSWLSSIIANNSIGQGWGQQASRQALNVSLSMTNFHVEPKTDTNIAIPVFKPGLQEAMDYDKRLHDTIVSHSKRSYAPSLGLAQWNKCTNICLVHFPCICCYSVTSDSWFNLCVGVSLLIGNLWLALPLLIVTQLRSIWPDWLLKITICFMCFSAICHHMVVVLRYFDLYEYSEVCINSTLEWVLVTPATKMEASCTNHCYSTRRNQQDMNSLLLRGLDSLLLGEKWQDRCQAA